MRSYILCGLVGIAIAVSCGGKTTSPDTGTAGGAGAGAATSSSGAGPTGGSTTGTGGAGAVGTTTTGTGGITTGTGGISTGTGGFMTTGASGFTTTGTGGITTTGSGGVAGGIGGSGGSGGAIDPGSEFSACTGAGQCVLAPAKCCGCGANLRLDELVAINSAKQGAYTMQSCGGTIPPCVPCMGSIDSHFMARCESGRCRGLDIRNDATHTGCGSSADCVLRRGLDCCECQSTGDWVALSLTGYKILSGETCAPQSTCASCVPVPPAGTKAVCVAGVCERMP